MKNMGNSGSNIVKNVVKTVVGDSNLNYIDELSDASDSDPFDDASFATDAAIQDPVELPLPERILNLNVLDEIETELEEDEIVSLVYLLFEDNHYALQELRLLLKDNSRKLLGPWAIREEKRNNPWCKKVVEGLCIIQNYKVLKDRGCNKQALSVQYLPHQPNVSLEVNKMRKLCYILCEGMDEQKTTKFIQNVNMDMKQKGHGIVNSIYPYLELHLIEWEIEKYITTTNIKNIKAVLKAMGDEKLFVIIEDSISDRDMRNSAVEANSIKAFERDNRPLNRIENETFQTSINFPSLETRQSSSTSFQPTTSTENKVDVCNSKQLLYERELLSSSIQTPLSEIPNSGRYSIDAKNPGVVLIINQQDFYTEYQEKYKHLLPPNSTEKLESRAGTEKDSNDLTKTFDKFGFKVIVENNLVHTDMVSKIKEVLQNITNESSLFICILSHGDKGIVYGSNSCRVKISKIQKLMYKTNRENLLDKPKVLILQSCQGQQCQRITSNNSDSEDSSSSDSESLTTDGDNRQSLPKTVDMFTFWATVPGYAAVRHKKAGSWFIQGFCKQMVELGNKVHFADICTSVINEVTQKKWNTPEGVVNVTTPMVVNTLRKSFFLPSVHT